MSKKLFALTVFIATSFMPNFANAAAAIAESDKTYAWARGDTQEDADQNALRLCRKEKAPSESKDCKLTQTYAVAEAVGKDRWGASFAATQREANRRAIDFCKAKDCKIKTEISTPGFVAIAVSEDFTNIHYGAASLPDAKESALAECERRSEKKCEIKGFDAIRVPRRKELASAAPNTNSGNCRPHSSNLRCNSRCVNGDCVVSYENGCQIRVRVSPRFDSFQNTWVYPSPSC